MRDELGGQVKKAIRGTDNGTGDIWSRATTEPPDAADQPPECAWCPICRAARRMAQSQGGYGGSGVAMSPGDAAPKGTAGLAGAADVLFGAARDALAGLDAVMSYRPGDASTSSGAADSPTQADAPSDPWSPPTDAETANEPSSERDHEPDHRS
jgi:hypothetical protein